MVIDLIRTLVEQQPDDSVVEFLFAVCFSVERDWTRSGLAHTSFHFNRCCSRTMTIFLGVVGANWGLAPPSSTTRIDSSCVGPWDERRRL